MYTLTPVTSSDISLFHEVGMILLSEGLTADEVVTMHLIVPTDPTDIDNDLTQLGRHLCYLVISLTEDRLIIARYMHATNQVIHWLPHQRILRLHYDLLARAFPLYDTLHSTLCPHINLCETMEMLTWIDIEREKHRRALENLDKLKARLQSSQY